jgi:hypothetical protein
MRWLEWIIEYPRTVGPTAANRKGARSTPFSVDLRPVPARTEPTWARLLTLSGASFATAQASRRRFPIAARILASRVRFWKHNGSGDLPLGAARRGDRRPNNACDQRGPRLAAVSPACAQFGTKRGEYMPISLSFTATGQMGASSVCRIRDGCSAGRVRPLRR